MVRSRAGSTSPITYIPYDQAYGPGFEDMMRRVPSLAKLQQRINFRPSTPIEDIVDAVIAEAREGAQAGQDSSIAAIA